MQYSNQPKESAVRRQLRILIVTSLILGPVQGCKWHDDFRDRQQPQILENNPRPTLNPDSKDYLGDDTHIMEDIDKNTPMPDIDALSPIPEVPEYPAGI